MTRDDQLQELARRLDDLEAENRSLRARLDDGAQPSTDNHNHNHNHNHNQNTDDARVVSRRRLMLGGGAAALGAVAATSVSERVAAAPTPLFADIDNPITTQTGVSGPVTDGMSTGIFTSAWFVSNRHRSTGTGVYAVAPTFGVAGLATTGVGVFGRSEGGNVAVHGYTYGDPIASPASEFTSGVWGQISSSYPGAPAFLADGQITLRTLANPGGVPDGDDAKAGDLSIRREADGSSTWWVCVQEQDVGVDAEFVRLAAPGASGAFEPLDAPIRVYDSRPAELPATGPKTPLAAGFELTVDCTLNTGGDVPADARALAINLTATESTDPGFLATFSADAAWAGHSNVNYAAGQNIANGVTVRCANGEITVRAGGSGSVHTIVDVIGFFR